MQRDLKRIHKLISPIEISLELEEFSFRCTLKYAFYAISKINPDFLVLKTNLPFERYEVVF